MAHSVNRSRQEGWLMQNRSTDPDRGVIEATVLGDVGPLTDLLAWI